LVTTFSIITVYAQILQISTKFRPYLAVEVFFAMFPIGRAMFTCYSPLVRKRPYLPVRSIQRQFGLQEIATNEM